jgi:hypothetical protein
MVRPRAAITYVDVPSWTRASPGMPGPTDLRRPGLGDDRPGPRATRSTTSNERHRRRPDSTGTERACATRARPLATVCVASVADIRWDGGATAGSGSAVRRRAAPRCASGLAVIRPVSRRRRRLLGRTAARLSRRCGRSPPRRPDRGPYVALPYLLGIVAAHGAWGCGRHAARIAGLCVTVLRPDHLERDVRESPGRCHARQTHPLLLRLGKDRPAMISIVAACGRGRRDRAGDPAAGPGRRAIALDAAAIVWMLTQARVTTDPTGQSSSHRHRRARGQRPDLIAVIAWLLLSAQGAPPAQASARVIAITDRDRSQWVSSMSTRSGPSGARVATRG